ncbi:acyl-CoA thioesterase II [Mycobacterium sp. NPDC006124]|uniref:acyl-CoA thioesterase II n=1 Tax=Mycobacterium sp. NPDC006124 TaxID=3156729 RepID=UPI0033B5589D
MSSSDLDELLAVLELTRVGDDLFTGSHPSRNPVRTFGGQMMAQAFVAASRTVRTGLPPSTLSVHFIAGGDPARDLEFHVVRLRDERRFANRRVDVRQGDVLLASALVSHMAGGRGNLEHGVEAPVVAEPLSVPSIEDLLIGYEHTVPLFVEALKPIEWRYTNDPAWVMRDKGDRLPHNRVWLTAKGAMPEDPVIHAAALVYSSDTTVLDSIITTHGLSWGFDRIFAVTMNHSVWFHRPVHFDDWVLYSTTSPVAAESRGLGTGHFFGRDGNLIATVVQEGIVKYFPESAAD